MTKRCSSGCKYEETRLDIRPGTPDFHEDSTSARRLVASRNSETDGKARLWPHDLHFILRTAHGEGFLNCDTDMFSVGDKIEYLDVNVAIRRIFMLVTLEAAVHLGSDDT